MDQLEQSRMIVYLIDLVAAMIVLEGRIVRMNPGVVRVLILSVLASPCLHDTRQRLLNR